MRLPAERPGNVKFDPENTLSSPPRTTGREHTNADVGALVEPDGLNLADGQSDGPCDEAWLFELSLSTAIDTTRSAVRA
jgi:hypothetical protein